MRVVKKYVLYWRVVFSGVWNFCVKFFRMWNCVFYFSVCGVSCYIFPHVEFRAIFFRVWNLVLNIFSVWYFVLYFSACGISCYIFRVWNCVLYFSACGISVLYLSACGIPCCIFLRVKFSFCIFLRVEFSWFSLIFPFLLYYTYLAFHNVTFPLVWTCISPRLES